MWSISPKGIHKPHLYIGSQWTRSSKWSVVIVPIIPTHPVHFRTLQVLQNLILQKVPFSFVYMRSVNYPFVNLSNQRSSIDWVILVSLMQFKIDEHCSVVDPGFPRWRLFWPFFPKTAWNWTNFPRRWHASLAPSRIRQQEYLRSTSGQQENNYTSAFKIISLCGSRLS